MRIYINFLFFFTLLNFSGIPEILPEILGDDHAKCALIDEECCKEEKSEKEDSSEQEDGKESILSHQSLFANKYFGITVFSQTVPLNETGYVPEDHSPPPEFS